MGGDGEGGSVEAVKAVRGNEWLCDVVMGRDEGDSEDQGC